MDKLWPTLLIVVILALVFLGMWLGWRRRARRDAALVIPTVLDAPGAELAHVTALHAATTRHDRPLDRVVVPGLAFRSNATVTVYSGGLTLAAAGESGVAIEAADILGVGAATWTIDRTVEPGGLVLLAWNAAGPAADGGTTLDTYLRVTDPDERRRLVDAVRAIVPASPTHSITPNTTPTGADDVAEPSPNGDTTTGNEA